MAPVADDGEPQRPPGFFGEPQGAGLDLQCRTAGTIQRRAHEAALAERAYQVPHVQGAMAVGTAGHLVPQAARHTGEEVAIRRFRDEDVHPEPAEGGAQETIPADHVLLCIGLKPNASLRPALVERGCNAAIYEIGSGRKNGNVLNAVHEAFAAAYSL